MVTLFTPEFIKINFDGSLIHSLATGGFLIRDWTEKLIKAGETYYGQTSIIVVEPRALRDGYMLQYEQLLTKLSLRVIIKWLSKLYKARREFHGKSRILFKKSIGGGIRAFNS